MKKKPQHHEVQNYSSTLFTTGLLQKNNPHTVSSSTFLKKSLFWKGNVTSSPILRVLYWWQKALLLSSLLLFCTSIGSYVLNLSKHLTATITQLTWHFPFFMHKHPILVLHTLHISLLIFSHAIITATHAGLHSAQKALNWCGTPKNNSTWSDKPMQEICNTAMEIAHGY